MRPKRVLAALICFVVLGSKPGFGQTDTSNSKKVQTVNGYLAFQVGIPVSGMQAAIKNNMGNTGFGGGFAILSNPFSWGKRKRNSSLRIGGELGYTYYGRFLTDVNIGGYDGS